MLAPHAHSMPAEARLRAIALLRDACGGDGGGGDNDDLAREIEAAAHAVASCEYTYYDHVTRCALNAKLRPENASRDIVVRSDAELSRNTLLDRIRQREQREAHKFQTMLQEKVESIRSAEEEDASSLRCRRCDSTDISNASETPPVVAAATAVAAASLAAAATSSAA